MELADEGLWTPRSMELKTHLPCLCSVCLNNDSSEAEKLPEAAPAPPPKVPSNIDEWSEECSAQIFEIKRDMRTLQSCQEQVFHRVDATSWLENPQFGNATTWAQTMWDHDEEFVSAYAHFTDAHAATNMDRLVEKIDRSDTCSIAWRRRRNLQCSS